jgi:AcrR family transcriptional regulator
VAGALIAWAGPLACTAISQFALTASYSWPLTWAARPPTDRGGWIAAVAVFAVGLTAFTARGPRIRQSGELRPADGQYPGVMTASQTPAGTWEPERRRRPRGAVRDGLVAAGLELARTGGPDGVVLREATRMVGVVPNAAYRHFADRDELLAAVCAAAMRELGGRMAADVARVPGRHGDPDAARRRLGAMGLAYLHFAREEPGLFATAFAVPEQHPYRSPDAGTGPERTPLDQLRAALDELVDAGVLDRGRRDGIEYPVWSAVHGLAVLAGEGPLRDADAAARRHLEELTLTFIGRGLS